MTFSDADFVRMTELENASRLADLEIERTPLKDVGKLDIVNMTAGEVVTLANVMESVRVLTDTLKRDAQESGYAGYSPSTSERRTGYNYATQAEAGPPPSDEESRAAIRKLREYLSERLSEEPMVQTVGGPIKLSEVPRDEDGTVDAVWLDANCTCDDHEKMRIDADKQKATGIGDPSIATGLYL